MTVDAWRSKHRRCEFCEHMRFLPGSDVTVCMAKRKLVIMTLPRLFCRLFQLERTDHG